MAFGRLYIANPDLVARFTSAARLNAADPSTFGSTKGYTDYPAMSEPVVAATTTPQSAEIASARD
jgi:N-ethylmaleimide reductase